MVSETWVHHVGRAPGERREIEALGGFIHKLFFTLRSLRPKSLCELMFQNLLKNYLESAPPKEKVPIYEGETKTEENGEVVYHGIGKLIYEDGSSYEGQWVDGQKSGFGTQIYKLGEKYQGMQ